MLRDDSGSHDGLSGVSEVTLDARDNQPRARRSSWLPGVEALFGSCVPSLSLALWGATPAQGMGTWGRHAWLKGRI